mgnify:CR=1 FL=1
MNAQFTGLWAFAYNPETMLRRLVAIFSLMFIFGASVYASDVRSGAHSLDIAGDTHWMQVLNGQDLAEKPANPDSGPDPVSDSLANTELSDWPEAHESRVHSLHFSPRLVLTRFFVAAPSLPWPYLAAPQRPPDCKNRSHATPDNVHRPFHALSAFLPPLAFLRGNSGNTA